MATPQWGDVIVQEASGLATIVAASRRLNRTTVDHLRWPVVLRRSRADRDKGDTLTGFLERKRGKKEGIREVFKQGCLLKCLLPQLARRSTVPILPIRSSGEHPL